jgi:hypothetical protein
MHGLSVTVGQVVAHSLAERYQNSDRYMPELWPMGIKRLPEQYYGEYGVHTNRARPQKNYTRQQSPNTHERKSKIAL